MRTRQTGAGFPDGAASAQGAGFPDGAASAQGTACPDSTACPDGAESGVSILRRVVHLPEGLPKGTAGRGNGILPAVGQRDVSGARAGGEVTHRMSPCLWNTR